MNVSIGTWDPAVVADDDCRAQLAEVYRSAFVAPPWNESDERVDHFLTRLSEDATRDGFRLAVAISDGQLVGFGTAWITPAPLRSDRAYGRVMEALGPVTVAERLCGAFEIDELAVHRSHRGKGIAPRLLDRIVGPSDSAWLLTAPHAREAVDFYRHIGWEELTAGHPADVDVYVFATRPHPSNAPTAAGGHVR